MPAKSSPKKVKRTVSKAFIVPLICLALGGLFLGVWSAKRMYSWRALRVPSAVVSPISVDADQESRYIPKSLTIGTLLTIEVDEAQLTKSTWSISPIHATYLPTSGVPGKPGNIILYGHNKRNIFANLRHVKEGQVIDIVTSDNILHRYSVTIVKTVKPTDIEYLMPTIEETLTLYTCTGILDQNRLIVVADPL